MGTKGRVFKKKFQGSASTVHGKFGHKSNECRLPKNNEANMVIDDDKDDVDLIG